MVPPVAEGIIEEAGFSDCGLPTPPAAPAPNSAKGGAVNDDDAAEEDANARSIRFCSAISRARKATKSCGRSERRWNGHDESRNGRTAGTSMGGIVCGKK